MNIIELEQKLKEIGVPEDLYSMMTGGLPNEKLCITRKDEWQVYYSERGCKSGLKTFKKETDACEYFFCKLKRYAKK